MLTHMLEDVMADYGIDGQVVDEEIDTNQHAGMQEGISHSPRWELLDPPTRITPTQSGEDRPTADSLQEEPPPHGGTAARRTTG